MAPKSGEIPHVSERTDSALLGTRPESKKKSRQQDCNPADGNDSKPNHEVKEEPMKTVTNLPVSTDFRTEVETIPVLTADNFAAIRDRFREYPVPAHITEDDLAPSNSTCVVRLLGYNKITTATGQPTDWFVREEAPVMYPVSLLPCSVAHCEGHVLSDLFEDSWDVIFHDLYKAPLPEKEFGNHYSAGGAIYLRKQNENYLASFHFSGEGDLPVNDLDDLVEHLQQTITAVQKFKETATVIALATATVTLEEV